MRSLRVPQQRLTCHDARCCFTRAMRAMPPLTATTFTRHHACRHVYAIMRAPGVTGAPCAFSRCFDAYAAQMRCAPHAVLFAPMRRACLSPYYRRRAGVVLRGAYAINETTKSTTTRAAFTALNLSAYAAGCAQSFPRSADGACASRG